MSKAPFGALVPYGDPSWYRTYNRRAIGSFFVGAFDNISLLIISRFCGGPERPVFDCVGAPRSPYYKDTHIEFRKRVRDFVEAEITPYCSQWDEEKKIPRELFAKAFKARSSPSAAPGLHCPVARRLDHSLLLPAAHLRQAGLLPGVVGPPWPAKYAGPGPKVRPAATPGKGTRCHAERRAQPRPACALARTLTRSTSSSSSTRSAAAAAAAWCGAWLRACRSDCRQSCTLAARRSGRAWRRPACRGEPSSASASASRTPAATLPRCAALQ